MASYSISLVWLISSLIIVFSIPNENVSSDSKLNKKQSIIAGEDGQELNGMTFRIRTVGGETNSLQIGNSIHYKLEISLLKGINELVLEIHTLDSPLSNSRSLSLYNFTMPYETTGLQFNIPEPKFFLSNKTSNVFDRLILDFGSIKNIGPERNILTIGFSVILIRKTRKTKKKHTVQVGVEYGKGSLSWVAQSEITTGPLLSKDDQIFCEVKFVELAEKIALDSAISFRFDANLQFRSDLLKIELNKSSYEYEPDNLISLGLISVKKFGKNFQSLPNTSRHYIGYKNKTISNLSYSKSVLDMNMITNNGEKSRTFIKNPENIISFMFTIYALNFEENIGKNASFNIDLYIGRRSYYSKTFNLTIVERNRNEKIDSFLLDSSGVFTNQNISKGQATLLKIRNKFQDFSGQNIFTNYSIIIETPNNNNSQLSFVPCAARFVNEESGLNLPYLDPRNIKPVREKEHFVFHFGRVNFIKLIDNFSMEDNYVVVEIAFRVPFDATIHEWPIGANAKVVSGNQNKPVIIEENSIYLEESVNQSTIVLDIFSSAKWNELIINGGVALNIELGFQSNTAYQNFQISIMKYGSSSLIPDLNICQFSVVKVSQNIPCTCVEKEAINYQGTFYENSENQIGSLYSFHNRAKIDFGSISVVNDAKSKGKILTNFVIMIEEKFEDLESYPIKIDVVSNNDTLVSDVMYLNISDTLSQTIDDMSIDLYVELLENKSIIPGFTANILIKTLTAPNTMGPLNIEVYSEENEMLSICGLWVHRVGYNLPCVDRNRKATYDFINYGQNSRATLYFEMITNFGNQIRKSQKEENNDNTLEFITMVRVSQEAIDNEQTLKIKVDYGKKNNTIIKELIIPVTKTNTAMEQLRKPRKVLLNTPNGNKYIHNGIPKLFYFDIELEENTQTSLSIMMNPSNAYTMCNAAFIKIGKNYPCYSPFALNVEANKFELGIICNTYLYKNDPEDNLLRLAFVLKPNDNISETLPLQVSGLVYADKQALDYKNELSLIVDADHSLDRFTIDKGATVEAESNDNIGLKIRERKWIVFNIRIPAFSTGKLTIVVQSQTDRNRSFIVLYNLRIVHAGANIPCPFENVPKIQLNSTINTNQMDLMVADLGWFSNFGFTYSIDSRKSNNNQNLTDKFNDDLLKIEVLAELTDHPSLSENGVYKLHFQTHFGNTTNIITRNTWAKISLLALDDPKPKLDVSIKYNKKMPILDRNETFTLAASIKHLPESNAEPLNPVLRMFTPNFVEIISINWANTKELPSLIKINEGSTDILFPWILFDEELIINFTLQIDPNNIRGYGRKEVAILTPFRMFCKHFRLPNETKFPCSQMKHINYRTESSECNIPLGMESGKILDSQLSASSTIGRRFAPKNARPNMESFWSPNWQSSEHYFQIDFRRRTRLVVVNFQSIPGMRKITRFHVNYSNDGNVWYSDHVVNRVTYYGKNGKSFIEKPIEARMVRLIIDDDINSLIEEKNQYIAVKFELFGCYLGEQNHSFTQSLADFTTHYTDDASMKNRLISIDPNTNVIYFCDATSNDRQFVCYHSNSGGNSWSIIGRSIDSIEGFELATRKFLAIDYDRPSYFYSIDGDNWTPIDFHRFNNTISNPKFQKKIIIPRFNKKHLNKMDIRLGNWQANYEGLNYEDNQYHKAFWNKCCLLK